METTATEDERLAGRQAKCSLCDKFRSSHPGLPFFEYRGEGSRAVVEKCGTCSYNVVAHTPETMARSHMKRIEPHEFVPYGSWEYDLYYCGCRGWD